MADQTPQPPITLPPAHTQETVKVGVRLKIAVSLFLASWVLVALGINSTRQFPERLNQPDLRAYEVGYYATGPFFLPVMIWFAVFTTCHLLFSRPVTIGPHGVSTRRWSVRWDEVTGVRHTPMARPGQEHYASVILDITPEAHARTRWKNKRDSARPWTLGLPFAPARPYELRLQNILTVPGPQLAAYLEACRQHYTGTQPTAPPPSAPPTPGA